eukprot:501008_1
MTGRFVDKNEESEKCLYSLIASASNSMKSNATESHLKYAQALFENMSNRQINNNALWVNRNSLNQIQHEQLKTWITERINMCGTINWVQQFDWKIDGDDYKSFITFPCRKYINSKRYIYNINNEQRITFYLKCCAKYSDESKKCALFLYLNELPKQIESIRIEFDLLCDKKNPYKQYITPQWLSKSQIFCGSQTFSHKDLERNSLIVWHLGIKLIDIQYRDMGVDDKLNALKLENCDVEEVVFLLENYVFDRINNHIINQFKEHFVSYFKQNQIDGEMFLKMSKRKFIKSVVSYNNDNQKLCLPSMQVYEHLTNFNGAGNNSYELDFDEKESNKNIESKDIETEDLGHTLKEIMAYPNISKEEAEINKFIKMFKQCDVVANCNLDLEECVRIIKLSKLNGNIFVKGTTEYMSSIKFAKLFESIDNVHKKQWTEIFRQIKRSWTCN